MLNVSQNNTKNQLPSVFQRHRQTASITIKASAHKLKWNVRIIESVTFVALCGSMSSSQVYARERAELEALLTALNWTRHKRDNSPFAILVSPQLYSLLFGSKRLPKLDDLTNKVRRAHMEVKADVVIEPNRSQKYLDAARKRSLDCVPVLTLVPPQKPTPNSGLRRAA